MEAALKNLGILWLIVALFFSLKLSASPDTTMLHSDPMYRNLMKSFMLRGAVNDKHFQYSDIKPLQEELSNVLTQVYLFSQTKKNNPVIPQTEEYIYKHRILASMRGSFSRIKYISANENLYHFEDANSVALKMVSMAIRTLTEFAPYMGIRDKEMRDYLVLEFQIITENFERVHYAKNMSSFPRPELVPAKLSAQELYKSLTPPSVFSSLVSRLKGDKSRGFLPRFETRLACDVLFK